MSHSYAAKKGSWESRPSAETGNPSQRVHQLFCRPPIFAPAVRLQPTPAWGNGGAVWSGCDCISGDATRFCGGAGAKTTRWHYARGENELSTHADHYCVACLHPVSQSTSSECSATSAAQLVSMTARQVFPYEGSARSGRGTSGQNMQEGSVTLGEHH